VISGVPRPWPGQDFQLASEGEDLPGQGGWFDRFERGARGDAWALAHAREGDGRRSLKRYVAREIFRTLNARALDNT
jgi:hypothetical protein